MQYEQIGPRVPFSPNPSIALRTIAVILVALFLSILGFVLCRSITTAPGIAQDAAPLVETPFATATPFATVVPVTMVAPTLPTTAPLINVDLPIENSEWYIDGWLEDSIVVNVYGQEIRSDLAEFRNSQTNAAIVVQCIDPQASRPNLDFTAPVEQRDRFIYKGNVFWHTTNPSVQRFIFVRHGELQ